MADKEILREFLVSLGFQVDAPSEKKFDDTVEEVGKNMAKLGTRVAGVGLAAQAMVATFATQMEKLFYASQRTGATANNLKTLAFGGSQIGLSAETMTGAVEGLARSLRSNPGIKGLIESLGVKVTGRDPSKVLTDVVGQLKKMPFYVASQYGSMLGIDPDTLLMMQNNLDSMLAAQQKAAGIYKEAGLDYDKASEDMKEYSNTLKELAERYTVLGTAISVRMLPAFKAIAGEVGEAASNLAKLINSDASIKPMKGSPGSKTTGSSKLDSMIRGTWLEYFFNGEITPPGTRKVSGKVTNEPVAPPAAPTTPAAGSGGAQGRQPRGIRNNNPGNIEYGAFARSMGATGSDGRFAIFPTPAHGLRAMSALLAGYARRGLNTAAGIIGRWAPSNENNTSAYASAVSKGLGTTPDAQLNMRDPNVVAGLLREITKHESGVNPYTAAQFSAAAGGTTPVVMHQKTEINVHGVSDPKAAGNSVLAGQERVNGDMTRNLQGAVR